MALMGVSPVVPGLQACVSHPADFFFSHGSSSSGASIATNLTVILNSVVESLTVLENNCTGLVDSTSTGGVMAQEDCSDQKMLEYVTMEEVTWSYIVFFLALAPWFCYGLVTLIFTLSLIYGRTSLHIKTDPTVFMEELPGVSIIKPLMGVDPFLEVNLESHFTLTYPKFELLLCVQDDQDPAINLVKQLQERHPEVSCHLFTGGKEGILNPMVHNMAPAYEAAKYDIIWVSTSRIKASTEILNDMVGKMQSSKVALVHQMPFTTDQKGTASLVEKVDPKHEMMSCDLGAEADLFAAVEKVYFGTTVARYYLAFHWLGLSCFTGMSYLIKKRELDELNGLGWFGRFLAEDFFIAKFLHKKGFRHQVAAIPAQQNVSCASIAAYKARMVRWLRLRLNMMPFTSGVLEPLGESFPLGAYMSWSMYHFFGINPYLYFLAHISIWIVLDYLQLKGVQNGPLPFSKFKFLLAWLIREFLYVLVYFEAVINVRHITWGRRTFRLSNFGESLELVTDRSILPL